MPQPSVFDPKSLANDGETAIVLLSTPFHVRFWERANLSHADLTFVALNRGALSANRLSNSVIAINEFRIPKAIPIVQQIALLWRLDYFVDRLPFPADIRRLHILIPNDDALEYQFAVTRLQSRFARTVYWMYEEGIGSYVPRDCIHRATANWKAALYKLVFRKRYFNALGFRGSVADFYLATSPECFREEQHKERRALWTVTQHVSAMHPSAPTRPTAEILLAEALVEEGIVTSEDYLEFIDEFLGQIPGSSSTLFVKPHPRSNPLFLEKILTRCRGHGRTVELLPASLAIEAAVEEIRNSYRVRVHGTTSSSLFYLKREYPDVTIQMHAPRFLANSHLDCYAKTIATLIARNSVHP